jgi:hypothetical protein
MEGVRGRLKPGKQWDELAAIDRRSSQERERLHHAEASETRGEERALVDPWLSMRVERNDVESRSGETERDTNPNLRARRRRSTFILPPRSEDGPPCLPSAPNPWNRWAWSLRRRRFVWAAITLLQET